MNKFIEVNLTNGSTLTIFIAHICTIQYKRGIDGCIIIMTNKNEHITADTYENIMYRIKGE